MSYSSIPMLQRWASFPPLPGFLPDVGGPPTPWSFDSMAISWPSLEEARRTRPRRGLRLPRARHTGSSCSSGSVSHHVLSPSRDDNDSLCDLYDQDWECVDLSIRCVAMDVEPFVQDVDISPFLQQAARGVPLHSMMGVAEVGPITGAMYDGSLIMAIRVAFKPEAHQAVCAEQIATALAWVIAAAGSSSDGMEQLMHGAMAVREAASKQTSQQAIKSADPPLQLQVASLATETAISPPRTSRRSRMQQVVLKRAKLSQTNQAAVLKFWDENGVATMDELKDLLPELLQLQTSLTRFERSRLEEAVAETSKGWMALTSGGRSGGLKKRKL